MDIKRKDGTVIMTVPGDSLQWADLQWANLRDADLQGADLREADLWEADLQGANLQGANLQAQQRIVAIQASRHTIIAIDDDVRIGCKQMPRAEWLECFEVVGKESGYSESEIREYGIYLRAIAAVMEGAV